MTRIELKIRPDRRSSEPKTCLVFHYRQGPTTLKDIPEAVVLGLQLLTQIATALRRNNYEVSEPSTGKKSFGVTGMKCHMGTGAVGISAWPSDVDDQWHIRLGIKPFRDVTQSESVSWEGVREILNDVVTKLEGVRDPRWLSIREFEDAQQSARLRRQMGRNTQTKAKSFHEKAGECQDGFVFLTRCFLL